MTMPERTSQYFEQIAPRWDQVRSGYFGRAAQEGDRDGLFTTGNDRCRYRGWDGVYDGRSAGVGPNDSPGGWFVRHA